MSLTNHVLPAAAGIGLAIGAVFAGPAAWQEIVRGLPQPTTIIVCQNPAQASPEALVFSLTGCIIRQDAPPVAIVIDASILPPESSTGG